MQPRKKIALLPWGNLIEDFLDTIGVSFEQFCTEMTGGWLFGYVEALKRAGVETVLFCFSARVSTVERHLHRPTGAFVCVLPVPQVYQATRTNTINPYGLNVDEVYGKVQGIRRRWLTTVRDISPYLAMPLWLFARELRKENCQAIICQEYEYARFDLCVLVGKLMRIHVFATFQGGIVHFSRLEQHIRPHSVRGCAGLIVATNSEAQRVQAKYTLDPAKIASVFNPIDIQIWKATGKLTARQQLNIPVDAQVVVCHGRIAIRQKGLDILLDAWVQLGNERPDQPLLLLIIGTGPDVAEFRNLIAKKNAERIIWVDQYIHDKQTIMAYLSAADLYTLPSRHEGFPVAPIEAMACSLPVVATDAPGVADILIDGENSGGIIVPKENAKALAKAIGQVLDDATKRMKMAANARLNVEKRFSLEAIGAQLRTAIFSK
jgi:glycosyltransferase involved in cell wall biosynthesis